MPHLHQAARIGGNALALKANNMRLLLLTLLRRQPIARVRLARATQLSTTTVTNLVAELMEEGIVDICGLDTEAQSAGAGRPPLALRLRPESRLAIGVHIGVRHVRVALIDLQANLCEHTSFGIVPEEGAAGVVTRTSAAISEIVRRAVTAAREPNGALGENGAHSAKGASVGQIVGVGVGASGLVQSESGLNVLAPNLGWHNVPLRDLFAAELAAQLGDLLPAPLPVVVDNNVRCMALAESLFGVGRNVRALAYVYARVGVGAGLVVDGEIYRGADYGAGEIGHWVMTPRDGDLCSCGNRGCLETYISERVLMQKAEQVHPELTLGRSDPLSVIFDAARDGHLGLIELLEERAFYVGLALANLVNGMNPQLIMLGGWLHDAFDLIEPVVQRTMRRHSFGGIGEHVDILPTSFGNYDGVIGAGALALEAFFFARCAQTQLPLEPARAPWAPLHETSLG